MVLKLIFNFRNPIAPTKLISRDFFVKAAIGSCYQTSLVKKPLRSSFYLDVSLINKHHSHTIPKMQSDLIRLISIKVFKLVSNQKQSPVGVLPKRWYLPKFTGKHLCQSLFFNKVAGLRPATSLKKRLWHRCFPLSFAKFLRTPFLIEHLR